MSEMDRLVQVVRRLRAEDGCPWDRAQTHESLKPECIEEAAEVLCGINILTETGNAENLREELGDLLLQVVYHACIAGEEGLFTLEDVARTAADKMVRRHPHVFGMGAWEPSGGQPGDEVSGMEPGAGQGTTEPGAGRRAGEAEQKASWEEIKKAEKKGREWQEPYLRSAMLEAGELIRVAMRRKGFEE